MNIIDAFRSKFTSLVNGCQHDVSEKLIELATFFYKIDRRVSLEEQKYMSDFLEKVEWNSSVTIESFHQDCISKINEVLGTSEDQISLYLSNLMQEISDLGAVDTAKALAKEISDADGEIADDEVKYLELVMSFE